jgi:hypothetical protein
MLRAKGSLEESATSTRSGMRPLWREIHAGGHHTHEVVRECMSVRVSAQAIVRIASCICRLCSYMLCACMPHCRNMPTCAHWQKCWPHVDGFCTRKHCSKPDMIRRCTDSGLHAAGAMLRTHVRGQSEHSLERSPVQRPCSGGCTPGRVGKMRVDFERNTRYGRVARCVCGMQRARHVGATWIV